MSGYVHIYAPPIVHRAILSGTCPDCGKRSRFLAFAYEYFDGGQTCLRCGRRWAEGEWMPLDFVRGSRRKSIEAAKRTWRRLTAQGIAQPQSKGPPHDQ